MSSGERAAESAAPDEHKAREAGCDDYDTKPVDLERLLGKIQKLLGVAPARTSSWAAPTPTAPKRPSGAPST